MYYIHKNYFGSYYCITNQNGNVVENEQGEKQVFCPDPFVQAPGNSQNYNPYTYAFNNPLKYT